MTCKPHETIIGQGVRFNAEKKKVGNYYSTPVYSFRMRHTQCGGWIEIRTDPRNTAYVVVEGARKRETADDQVPGAIGGLGEIAVRLGGDNKEEDPLARLEGKVVDKKQAETATSRILDLQRRQDRDWDDPYEKSRRLRRTFRVERKGLERAEANREALKDKMSLGIDVADETEEDRVWAGLVDFGHSHSHTHPGMEQDAVDEAVARTTRLRPLFKSQTPSKSSGPANGKAKKHGRRHKAADLLAERRSAFRNELTGNTRAAVDPFLSTTNGSVWQPEVKRRRVIKPYDKSAEKGPATVEPQPPIETGKSSGTAALVDYGSDSS